MRWFVTRVLVIALPVVEVLLLVWVGRTIGWGWTAALLLAGLGLGLGLMRVAGVNAFRAVADPVRNRQPVVEIDPLTGVQQTIQPDPQPSQQEIEVASRELRRSGWLFVAGLLFAIPGFLTDLAAAVLALPPVRQRLADRPPRTVAREGGTVVIGETLVRRADGTPPPQGWVRGEILPPRPE